MKKRRFKRTLIFGLAVFAGLFVLSAVVFLSMSLWANSVRLPERLIKPPIALESEPAGAEFVSAPRPHPIVLRPEDFSKIDSYDDYLKLCLARDPSLKSAALYLELHKRYKTEHIEESFKEFSDEYDFNYITPEKKARLIEWLRVHAGFIELARRFARSGPLPYPTLAENREYTQNRLVGIIDMISKKKHGPLLLDNYPIMRQSLFIINTNAQMHISQKDFAEGRRCLEDGIQLIDGKNQQEGMISFLNESLMTRNTLSVLDDMVENPDCPVDELHKLIPSLDRAEKKILPPGRLSRTWTQAYLQDRSRIIEQLRGGTWRLPVYGWYADPKKSLQMTGMDLSVMYQFEFNFGNKKKTLPRVDRYVVDAFVAIHNRIHAIEALEKFDGYYREVIETTKRSYPEIKSKEKKTTTTQYQNFLQPESTKDPLTFTHLGIDNFLRISAQFRLARLGAMWRVDPMATLARRSEDVRKDPFHPWRDPYSEAPFQVDTASSPTLIWSVGPDLKDNPATPKDPTNADNIVIRLPR